MEFTNTGTEDKELLQQQVEGSGGGEYYHPTSVLSEIGLASQPSIFSLTFDEFQSSHGNHIGKDLGSLNIEELLKNICSAEESESPDPATCSGLQNQTSLKLPRTISMKTVDEVWRDFYPREENRSAIGGDVTVRDDEHGSITGREDESGAILGKMTLEQFLERAGVIREEIPSRENENSSVAINNTDSQPTTNTTTTGLSLGFPSATILPTIVIPHPIDQDTIFFPTTTTVGEVGDPVMMSNGGGLVESDAARYMGPSLSPTLPYVYDRGSFGKKKPGGVGVEKAVERRQKRMIKNRESAARSRARKQAYTTELEAEVKKLKEQNQDLQKKYDMLENEKNQAWEMVRQQQQQKKKPAPPSQPQRPFM
ncbi:BZIP transcription factor [Zostera marina]|uniref:BZIP transcription factor n=1 Tax=Zostera marina TaxID=29655 RepID=A0A0K9NQL9_ZOSMR|nr:BZIP transcription factor [Zostera marina]